MYTAFTYILIIITTNSTTNIGLILILSDALVGMHVSKSVCMYVCMHAFIHVSMHVCACMYVCMHVHMYVRMYVYAFLYVYAYAYNTRNTMCACIQHLCVYPHIHML